MQIWSAAQLGGPGAPAAWSGQLPTTCQGLALQNQSPWWLIVTREGTTIQLPPWCVLKSPAGPSEAWSITAVIIEAGGLSVGNAYVELDLSTSSIPFDIVPMTSLPIYETTIGGAVSILGQPNVIVGGGQSGSPGSNVLVAAPQIPLGTISVIAGNTTANLQATPDANATGMLLLCRPVGVPYTVEVIGTVTQIVYELITIGAFGGAALAFSIPANDDNPIQVVVTVTPAPVETIPFVSVYELTASGFTQVGNTDLDPLWVEQVPNTVFVVGGNVGSGGISVPTLDTPPQHSLFINAAGIAANGQATLIAGVVGERIRIRSLELGWFTAVATVYNLQSGVTGMQVGGYNVDFVSPTPIPLRAAEVVLPPGESLIIKNMFATAGPSYWGNIGYDLYT